jgi:peptidyl-prolyl cis-trans isomerase SurA
MKFWRKSVKPVTVAFAFGVILLATQPAWAKVVDRVVATVNGVIITLSTVQERASILLQQMKAAGESLEMEEKEFILKTLDSIIEEKLQLQEAKRARLDVDENDVQAALDEILSKNNITMEKMEEMLLLENRSMEQYKGHIRDQIMTSKVMQFHMGKFGEVSDKQIKKYYFQHQKDFWEPTKPFVRHILFIVEEGSLDEVRESKREQATQVLEQARSGADFSELAKEYSEDVSASSGGEVGWLTKGHLVPEFERAAFGLKAGELSDIVESRYGFHIIKVEKVRLGKAEPMDNVKEKIKQVLSLKARQEKYKEWINGLKKDSMIQITLFENEDVKEKSPGNDLGPSNDREEHWEEASNVKNKRLVSSIGRNQKNFRVMERKLAFIKKLRRHKKISEEEYHSRKQRLLDQL